MTTVYLIRHAEAEGNLYRRFQGWHDGHITQRGQEQIRALERRFTGVDIHAVYSSDLCRTMTTAGAIYRPRGLELHTDRMLREIGGGVWEDRTWGWLFREEPERLMQFFSCDPDWQVEGGERYEQVQQRVVGAIRRIAAAHEGETVAVVAHGTAIVCTLAALLKRPLHELPHGDNTCVAKLLFSGEEVEVAYFNDVSHLPERLLPRKLGPFRKETFVQRNLWFRPLDMVREESWYRQARQEAWQTSHGTLEGFEPEGFVRQARANWEAEPNTVLAAMQGERPVGILQMDDGAAAEADAGFVWFLYLEPEARGCGLGVQLLGQAVSRYRSLERRAIRLRCAPENTGGAHFYQSCGFMEVGRTSGGLGGLKVLEKSLNEA